ncbi:hypothetical protein BVC80_9075g103 [Macleaya cordata]|uniref:Uncharacterized protein n=1 Tax=Macleaya cordata TaxID=56857 RepID=A0A200PUH0_MACCD|nr:hypothetical protein BVC80_9075g103 [Macleaya cordata]
MDQATAEVVHIDMGVAFEQGLMLKTLEQADKRYWESEEWKVSLRDVVSFCSLPSLMVKRESDHLPREDSYFPSLTLLSRRANGLFLLGSLVGTKFKAYSHDNLSLNGSTTHMIGLQQLEEERLGVYAALERCFS